MTLTPQDFSRVGNTEGIPFVYRWERCRVYPYVGDGESAGREAAAASDTGGIIAYTLVKSFPGNSDDSPPSRSYLDLLIQGAEEWKLDRSFRDMLKSTSVARNLLVPNGLAGPMLSFAELRQQKRIVSPECGPLLRGVALRSKAQSSVHGVIEPVFNRC